MVMTDLEAKKNATRKYVFTCGSMDALIYALIYALHDLLQSQEVFIA